ncbi:MAG TPA: hypothetical protein DCO86_00295 [Spirochaetaceae bacterium]|nr:hypothetical protein [Spirochaetaceae bacterium]
MSCLCVTFDSHYHALLAKRLLGNGYFLAPTPRIVSSSCASCVECDLDDGEKVDDNDVGKYSSLAGSEGVYILAENGKVTLYERK